MLVVPKAPTPKAKDPIKPRSALGRRLSSLWFAAVMCFTFGIVIGFSIDEFILERFSTNQQAFIDGVVAGSRFKLEYTAWQAITPAPENDPRSDPTQRCAAAYFPNNDNAMEGCLQAVAGRPEGGYQIP